MSKALGLYLFYVELDNNDVYTALKQKVEETMTGTQWNGEDNEILPADFDEDTVSINQILKLPDIRVVFSLPMTSVIMSQALSPASFQRLPPYSPKTHDDSIVLTGSSHGIRFNSLKDKTLLFSLSQYRLYSSMLNNN